MFALGSVGAQLLQAACSFFATIIFIRELSPADFGLFAAGLVLSSLVLSANRTVLAEQLLVSGSHRYGYRDFVLIASGLFSVAVIPIVFALLALDLVLASAYLLLLVTSDALRYIDFARGLSSIRRLFVLDLIRTMLLGLALGLSLLGFQSYVCLWLCLSSAAVHPVRTLVAGVWPSFRRMRWFLARTSRYELLMSVQFLMGALAQLLPMVALVVFGPVVYGHLRAAQGLAAPVSLLSAASGPAAFAWLSSGTPHSQVRRAVFALVALVPMSAALGIGVFIALQGVGPFLVPEETWSNVSDLLLPSVVIGMIVLLALPGGVLLRSRRYGDVALQGQLVGLVAALVLVIVAVPYGILALAWSLTAGSFITVASTYFLLVRRLVADDNRG